MAAVLLFLVWFAGIGFSIYLITQTSGDGLPPSARSARTRAIILGFIPFYGIEIIGQLYYYSQYKTTLAAHVQIDNTPKTFGTSQPSQGFTTNPTKEPPAQNPPSGQSQQKNNPFL